MQLLYEFSKLSGKDAVTSMTKNWPKVCKSLLLKSDMEEDLSFVDERCALQMIEKNIYHKKPAMSLISFALVSHLGIILFLNSLY